MPLTARGLLPVNYGALEHTCCPRDPLAAKERERGGKKKKKEREIRKPQRDGGTGKEMSGRVIGQSKAPRVPAKHGFTSLRLIRDVRMKLKWWK